MTDVPKKDAMRINGKTFSQYAVLIQNEGFCYQNVGKRGWTRRESVSPTQTRRIREYFKAQAGLDLEKIEKSPESTWEKAMRLSVFVAKSVPHDNQKKPLNRRNAISLWEYALETPSGFNCRWHAILLSELMLAAGIKNCFVTCLPQDSRDNDCHVVNLLWLPEKGRWAMLDSDMAEYAVDEAGEPLSLMEMRECVRDRRAFIVRPLPGFEGPRFGAEDTNTYMQCYWAKNLFWFARHTSVRYNLESGFCLGDSYVCLVPEGYHADRQKFSGIETNDARAFWDI